LALALDPLSIVVLVVLLLDRAPRHAMRAGFVVAVLFPGAVERLLVDILGMLRQVVLDRVRQVAAVLVWHGWAFLSRDVDAPSSGRLQNPCQQHGSLVAC